MVLLAAAAMLAGCGNNQKITREQVVENAEIACSDIVSFIVVGFQEHWDGVIPDELQLSPVYSYSSPYAGFVQKDIDGDGFGSLSEMAVFVHGLDVLKLL